MTTNSTDQLTILDSARKHLLKAAQLKPEKSGNWFAVAQAEFYAGDFQSAFDASQKCVQLDPKNYDAWILLSECALQLGQALESNQAAKQAIQLNRQQEAAWLLGARSASAAGKHSEAIKLLEVYLKLNPLQLAGPLVYILLARNLLLTDNPKGALEHLEQAGARLRALGKRPGPEFAALRARVLTRMDRSEEALEYYQQALILAPQNAALQSELGQVLMEQGKHEEALRALRLALQFEPENASYYYLAGVAARQSAETPKQPLKRSDAFRQQALELLKKATQLDPNNFNYWFELAQVYASSGNYKLSKQTMVQILSSNLKGEDQEFLRLYTTACEKLGELDEAASSLKQMLATAPGGSDVHELMNELGEIYYQLGDFGEAFNYFRRAEMNSNDHPRYLTNMSRVLLKMERLDEARELVEEAASLQPDDYFVRHQIGVVLLKTNSPAEALEHLKEAAIHEPDNAEFRYYLGRAFLHLGQNSAAIREYQAALNVAPLQHEWQAELAGLYLQEHEYLPALETQRLAAQIKPSEPDYQYNLAIALAANGDLWGAVNTLQGSMAELGDHVGASWHYLLGRLLVELGRLDEALDSFAVAHRLKPHNPHYKVDLAKTLRLKGEPIEQVKALLEEAIAEDPDELQSFEELAYVYEASNNHDAAIRTLEARLSEVLETMRIPELVLD